MKKISEYINDHTLQSIGLMSFQKALAIGINFLLTYVLVNYGSQEIYGSFMYIFSFLMIASVVLKFGYDLSYTKLLGSFKNKVKELSKNYLKIDAFIFMASFIFAIACYFLFPEDYYFFLVSIPMYTLILLNSGKLRGIGKANLAYFYTALARVLFLIVGIVLVVGIYGHINFHQLAIIYLVSIIILFISSVYFVWKFIPIGQNQVDLLEFNRYNFYLGISTILFVLPAWGDRFLLGLLGDSTQVAQYDIGLKMAMIMTVIFEITNTYFSPKYSASKDNKRLLQTYIHSATFINVLVSFLLFLILLFFGKHLISLFNIPIEFAYEVCLVFAVGYLLSSFFGPVLNVIQMIGLMNKFLGTYALILLFCILCGAVLTYFYQNLLYIAVGLALNMILIAILGSRMIKRKTTIETFILQKNVSK